MVAGHLSVTQVKAEEHMERYRGLFLPYSLIYTGLVLEGAKQEKSPHQSNGRDGQTHGYKKCVMTEFTPWLKYVMVRLSFIGYAKNSREELMRFILSHCVVTS